MLVDSVTTRRLVTRVTLLRGQAQQQQCGLLLVVSCYACWALSLCACARLLCLHEIAWRHHCRPGRVHVASVAFARGFSLVMLALIATGVSREW